MIYGDSFCLLLNMVSVNSIVSLIVCDVQSIICGGFSMNSQVRMNVSLDDLLKAFY